MNDKDTRCFEITLDTFIDQMGQEYANNLTARQDVTEVFSNDNNPPVKAVVVSVIGPGGVDPWIEFTFWSADHSWAWASTNLECDRLDWEWAGW